MAMLDRYKKKGGFSQLLQLIETSPQKKREQFLALIAEENPVWEEQLRKRLLSIEKIFSWNQQHLAEILSRLQPLTLAVAIHGTPPAEIENLLLCLPPITKRKIMDLVAEANPSPAEKATCLMKIIAEVRGFVAQGILKLEKIDPELHVAENIEEILSNLSAGLPADVIVVRGGEPEPSVAKAEPRAGAAPPGEGTSGHSEVEFLKRKLTQMSSEINVLRNENALLKDKLLQIKKIA